MRKRKIIDRNEAWWAAWELAHNATCLYEAYTRDVDRETAIAALSGNKFPDEQTLRWRLTLASRVATEG